MPKPKWLEGLEQFAHGAMGFGCRLLYLDYVLWWRENVKQWPPGDVITVSGKRYCPEDRVWDKSNDERSYLIGAYVAEAVRWAGIAAIIWWKT